MATPLTRDTLRQHVQRFLRRMRAIAWRPARILLPSPQPALMPPHTDFDFCPWLFWREATLLEQKSQLDYQALLKNTGQVDIGARCFISTLAGLVPTFLSLGDDSYVGAYVYITDEVEMGDHCTLNPYAIVRGKVKMGDGVRVGSQTSILGFDHQFDDPDRPIYQQGLRYRGITIGDDVWVGASVVVTDGVTIGSHSVVGAGAVVTHDIPPYSVAVGNPARVVRSRRPGALSSSLQANLKNFGKRVAAEWPQILQRSYQEQGTGAKFLDFPGAVPTVRAWCDAVEIASFFETLPGPFSKTALVERLQSFQEAETGLLPSPYGKRPSQPDLWRLRDFTSRYNILAVGYALEVLGARFRYPITAVEKLADKDLNTRLKGLAWSRHAWNAGDWVDCFGTGLYFNLKQFGATQTPEPLLGWLIAHVDKLSGMWGRPTLSEGWLQPVNGFYRITRGTFAQFGVPVPYPEAVIDTMLAHSRDSRFFNEKLGTACNVLDVAHPLWLCGLQTHYRRAEVEQWAAGQAQLALDRWRPGQGFSFKIKADDPASLKGTEMWLSIVYLLAELCGESAALGYRPRGVHRLEPAWVLTAV